MFFIFPSSTNKSQVLKGAQVIKKSETVQYNKLTIKVWISWARRVRPEVIAHFFSLAEEEMGHKKLRNGDTSVVISKVSWKGYFYTTFVPSFSSR